MQLDRIRNIGIVAHIDAGKTTVTERVLFYCGVERRMGEVHEGTATMDWMEEERQRGITISAAVTHVPWRDHHVQIIDTPGHVDFTAEVARSMRVIDGAVLVLDGVAGVQAQTETVVRQAHAEEVPCLAFVNKMDRPGADFARAVASLRAKVHERAVPVQLPIGEGPDFAGVIDLVGMRALRFDPESEGVEIREEEIPAEHREAARSARERLAAAVAELDEAWLEAYVEEDDLPAETLHEGLARGTRERRLVPVLCGAALRNVGVQPLLDAVVDWLPSPLQRPPVVGHDPDTGAARSCPPEPDAPAVALAFKVTHEGHGELVHFRVFSGTVRAGEALLDVRTGKREKPQPLYWMHAERREKREEFGPGGLFAVPGMKRVATGDTLCDPEHRVALEAVAFPQPVLRQTVEAREAGDRDRLEDALRILEREDPTLHVDLDEETETWLLAGMGELHLEVAAHRLERDFGLKVRTGRPRVSYRERATSAAGATGRLSLPGEAALTVSARVRVEPREELAPRMEVAPGCVELPHGVAQALADPSWPGSWAGPAGHPLVQTRVLLEDWSVEPEGRAPEPEQLQGAIHLGLQESLAEGGATVLEPVMDLAVEVPEEHLSGVLADLQQRHAEIDELGLEEGRRVVTARVSMARMFAYSTTLRSLTQGKGTFSLSASGYAPRPEGAGGA